MINASIHIFCLCHLSCLLLDSLGGGETDAISFFAQTAATLQKEHPLIHYHIYSGDADIVTEKIDKGLIDFGLLIGPFDVTKYDYMRLPMTDTWGVLMRKDSPLAEKGSVCAEDLWDKSLILSHQASISSEMISWLKKDVSKLNVVMTYDLIYNASHFVRKGLGYVIALDKLINTTGDSELCFRPLYPRIEAELCIVWKKYQVFCLLVTCPQAPEIIAVGNGCAFRWNTEKVIFAILKIEKLPCNRRTFCIAVFCFPVYLT